MTTSVNGKPVTLALRDGRRKHDAGRCRPHPPKEAAPWIMRVTDPKVQITALLCITVLVITFVVAISRVGIKAESSPLVTLFGVVLAIVIPQIMALFKADETSRKVDEVRDIATQTRDQTNGGLHDNVEQAVREALTKILTGNTAEAKD